MLGVALGSGAPTILGDPVIQKSAQACEMLFPIRQNTNSFDAQDIARVVFALRNIRCDP